MVPLCLVPALVLLFFYVSTFRSMCAVPNMAVFCSSYNNNNNNNNKILTEETERKCRLCKQYEETIDHLTSGCPILAKNEYLMRHDKVCTHLH